MLLKKLRPALIGISKPGVEIYATIVNYTDVCGGLYVPRELIQLLAEVDASIDFDQYHYPDGADGAAV